jgi:PKD repeat protein
VSNPNGCTDLMSEEITVSDITAAISPIPDVNCVGELIEFIDASDDAVEWLWNFGNDVSSSLANPTTIYQTPDIYTVSLLVTNIDGCSDLTSIEANVEICTGIDDVEGITSFSLIPNPAKENFKISVALNSMSNFYIEIIDINGKIVFNEAISNQSDYTRTFNSDQFGKGIYLIKVSSGENVAWKKLIIN